MKDTCRESGLGIRLLLPYAYITGAMKNPLLPDPECKGQAGNKVHGTYGIGGVFWLVKSSL